MIIITKQPYLMLLILSYALNSFLWNPSNNTDDLFTNGNDNIEILNNAEKRNPIDERKKFHDVEFTLDEISYSWKLEEGVDPSVFVANFCLKYPKLSMQTCGEIYDAAIHYLKGNNSMTLQKQNMLITSPRSNLLYPYTQRVYIEFSNPLKALDVCMYLNLHNESFWCGSEPLEDIMYASPNSLKPGKQLIVVRRKQDNSIVDALFFQITDPKITISNMVLHPEVSNSMQIELQLEDFDLRTPGDDICLLVDDNISCISDSANMDFNPKNFFLLCSYFNVPQGIHQFQALLLNQYNKSVAVTMPKLIYVNETREVTEQRINRHLFKRGNDKPFISMLPDSLNWINQLSQHEWGLFSQNGEDGILQSIFRNIGITNNYYVEFGVEDGSECNTRYLREYFNWSGILMDSGFDNPSLNLKKEWISAENINELFSKYKVPSEFDLLSIDIDYNDYWVWNAIDNNLFSPRVIVVESNSHIPPEEKKVVPYSEKGKWDGKTNFFGAGIGAFYQLGIQKGYSPVYCESHGVNCFFVRNKDLGYNLSSLIGPSDVFSSTNFFGKGWTYPNNPSKEKTWISV